FLKVLLREVPIAARHEFLLALLRVARARCRDGNEGNDNGETTRRSGHTASPAGDNTEIRNPESSRIEQSAFRNRPNAKLGSKSKRFNNLVSTLCLHGKSEIRRLAD